MRLVAISDTHCRHREIELPAGDLLVHAGDIGSRGEEKEIREFDDWLGSLPHRHKIIICGNHDFYFERQPDRARALITNGIYLEDEAVEIEGYKIYGSPWQPWFFDWAFNLQRGAPLKAKWAQIPPDTDLLVTHGPPFGHGDLTFRGERVGCEDLLEAVTRVQPRWHIFGHIHEGYGVSRQRDTTCINASTCNIHYQPLNPPVVVDLGSETPSRLAR